MESYKVSIIIPTYNRAQLLVKALTSVANQSYPVLEVLVVDDGSTDNTIAVIQPFLSDKRFKYIRLDSNKGRSAARNIGLDWASGDFMMFLDSDDYLEPDALALLIELSKQNPEVKVFAGGYRLFRYENNKEFTIYKRGQNAVIGDLFLEEIKEMVLNIGNSILHKDLFKNKPRFDESLDFAEDWLFLLQIIRGQSAVITNALVSNVYRHKDNTAFRDIQQAIIIVAQKFIDELGSDVENQKYIDNFLLRQLMAYNRSGRKRLALQYFLILIKKRTVSQMALLRESCFLAVPSLVLILFRNFQLRIKTYINTFCNK